MKKECRKYVVPLLVLIIIGLFTFAMESFVFNYNFFKLPDNEKGVKSLSLDKLILSDLELKDGKFVITGKSPKFSINSENKVMYLGIVPSEKSEQFLIVVKRNNEKINENDKNYVLNSLFKKTAVLKIDNNLNNVEFLIIPDEGVQSIGLSSLFIDNSFRLNYSRMVLVFSVLNMIIFGVMYKSIFAKKIHIAFIFILICMGINFVFSTPPYFSFDEREHFVKAYQISAFDIGIKKDQKIYWPENIVEFFKFNGEAVPFDTFPEKENYINEFLANDYSNLSYQHSTAVNYLPMAYIPAAIGVFIGRVLQLPFILTFYFGRLFNLLCYASILFFTIKKVDVAKKLIFLLGLFPGMVYLASAYSADGMTYAFAIVTVAIFLNMLSKNRQCLNRKYIIMFAIGCMLTIMCKPTYAPLCLLIFAIPNFKFACSDSLNISSDDEVNKKVKKKGLIIKLSVIVISGLSVLLSLGFSIYNGLNQWALPGVSVKGQTFYILTHIPQYLITCSEFVIGSSMSYFKNPIGNFAYAGNMGDLWILTIIIVLFVVAIIDNESEVLFFEVKNKVLISFALLLSWGLVMTLMYITFVPVGSSYIDGVQGRYFAPMLLPFLLLFKNNKVVNSFNKKNMNAFLYIISATALFAGVLKIFIMYNA